MEKEMLFESSLSINKDNKMEGEVNRKTRAIQQR